MTRFPSLVSGLPAGNPIRFSGLGIPREPVPDGYYIARLGPSTKLPFHDRGLRRINYEAEIIRPIGNPAPGSQRGRAYGHLYSSRRYAWRDLPPRQWWGPIESESTLTRFLKTFGLYQRGMSTARRVRAAKELIESRPVVVVLTMWVAYSRQQDKTIKCSMSEFPRRADGTHDPYICTEDGEQIRAVAHIDGCWPLEWLLDHGEMDALGRRRFTRSEIEAAYYAAQELSRVQEEVQ